MQHEGGSNEATSKLPPHAGSALVQFELAAQEGHQRGALEAAKIYLAGNHSPASQPSLGKAAELLNVAVAAGWPKSGKVHVAAHANMTTAGEASRVLGILTAAGYDGHAPQTASNGEWSPLSGREIALYRLAASAGDTIAKLALAYRHRVATKADKTHRMVAAYYYRWVAQQSYRAVHNDKKSFYIEKKRLSDDWIRPTANIDHVCQYYVLSLITTMLY